jgi:hypothetical protein
VHYTVAPGFQVAAVYQFNGRGSRAGPRLTPRRRHRTSATTSTARRPSWQRGQLLTFSPATAEPAAGSDPRRFRFRGPGPRSRSG